MNRTLTIGDFTIDWLSGGRFRLDGGAMFGVVPRKLWERKYPHDGENCIDLVANPILVRTPSVTIVIETGIGNKLTDRQKSIFQVQEDWNVMRSLEELGMSAGDIDVVILTHCDFDHAGGIIMQTGGERTLSFPGARHVVQRLDWEDALSPGKRAANSYWEANYDVLRESGKLQLIDGEDEVAPGIRCVLTGGHHRGHQIVVIESGKGKAVHLGDLLPTHAHFNPLWVMAYDDYPLETIRLKEEWEQKAIGENAWFLFYHDTTLSACRFDEKGNVTEKHP